MWIENKDIWFFNPPFSFLIVIIWYLASLVHLLTSLNTWRINTHCTISGFGQHLGTVHRPKSKSSFRRIQAVSCTLIFFFYTQWCGFFFFLNKYSLFLKGNLLLALKCRVFFSAIIGPPKLSLSGCGNCLNISIDLPNHPDSFDNFYNAITFDIHWRKVSDVKVSWNFPWGGWEDNVL